MKKGFPQTPFLKLQLIFPNRGFSPIGKNEIKVFGKGSGEEPFLRKVCPRSLQEAKSLSGFNTGDAVGCINAAVFFQGKLNLKIAEDAEERI